MATDIRNLSIQFKSVKPAAGAAGADADAGKGKDKTGGKDKDGCTSAAKGNGEPGGWRVEARRQWAEFMDMQRER